MKPIRTANIPWRVIDGRAVIVQPSSGKVHELNPVAAFLWKQADGSHSLESIVEELQESFEETSESAIQDARAFFSELETHGLIRWEA